MKIFFNFFIIPLLLMLPFSFAQEKQTGIIQQNIAQDTETVTFKISQDLILSNGTVIPKNSIIIVDILDIQNARRWHKSAFLVSKLRGYSINEETNAINKENDDIYLVIRKYEELNKKELGKTAVEVGTTTAVSFFIPGIDIAYYFTKGAIKNDNGSNRFTSGISTAYENSIFWFWLKGKSLDLDENVSIKLQEVSAQRAEKLLSDIDKRKERTQSFEHKKENFKEFMSY